MYRVKLSTEDTGAKFADGVEITHEWKFFQELTKDLKRLKQWGEIIIEEVTYRIAEPLDNDYTIVSPEEISAIPRIQIDEDGNWILKTGETNFQISPPIGNWPTAYQPQDVKIEYIPSQSIPAYVDSNQLKNMQAPEITLIPKRFEEENELKEKIEALEKEVEELKKKSEKTSEEIISKDKSEERLDIKGIESKKINSSKAESKREIVKEEAECEKVIWKRQNRLLIYFIARLCDKGFIKNYFADEIESIICKHFQRKDGSEFNKESLRIARIEMMSSSDEKYKKPKGGDEIDELLKHLEEIDYLFSSKTK